MKGGKEGWRERSIERREGGREKAQLRKGGGRHQKLHVVSNLT